MANDSVRQREPLDLEALDREKLVPRMVMAGEEYVGQPYALVSEDGIALVGGEKRVISVSDDFGVSISDYVNLSAMPEQVSFGGGYWRINPLVLSTLPSTTPTPVPWLQKSKPRLLKSKAAIQGIVSDMRGCFGI